MGANSPAKHPTALQEMTDRNLTNRTSVADDDGGPAKTPSEAGAQMFEAEGSSARAWLYGAYTFLILWGMAYLVLFFTDRLP